MRVIDVVFLGGLAGWEYIVFDCFGNGKTLKGGFVRLVDWNTGFMRYWLGGLVRDPDDES